MTEVPGHYFHRGVTVAKTTILQRLYAKEIAAIATSIRESKAKIDDEEFKLSVLVEMFDTAVAAYDKVKAYEEKLVADAPVSIPETPHRVTRRGNEDRKHQGIPLVHVLGRAKQGQIS